MLYVNVDAIQVSCVSVIAGATCLSYSYRLVCNETLNHVLKSQVIKLSIMLMVLYKNRVCAEYPGQIIGWAVLELLGAILQTPCDPRKLHVHSDATSYRGRFNIRLCRISLRIWLRTNFDFVSSCLAESLRSALWVIISSFMTLAIIYKVRICDVPPNIISATDIAGWNSCESRIHYTRIFSSL